MQSCGVSVLHVLSCVLVSLTGQPVPAGYDAGVTDIIHYWRADVHQRYALSLPDNDGMEPDAVPVTAHSQVISHVSIVVIIISQLFAIKLTVGLHQTDSVIWSSSDLSLQISVLFGELLDKESFR